MGLPTYTARDFADALRALLPPGAAWEWPVGGTGDALLLATAQELARVAEVPADVLAHAIASHTPGSSSFHISAYRLVASNAVAGSVETMPRKVFAVGSRVSDRLWSGTGPETVFSVDLWAVDPTTGPARVGMHAGDLLWGSRSRVVLRVRYYQSVVDPRPLWEALTAFKQAHIYLWFEDITGSGGRFYAAD
jgi:hypothetical protein